MTHYQRLGVATDATAAELRSAYRRAAQAVHPDRAGEASSAAMASINEAYRVLSDPASRRAYDATLRSVSPGPSTSGSGAGAGSAAARIDPVATAVPPGRFPWRFLLVMGLLACTFVVIAAVLIDPAPEAPIDNILRPGDCVVLTPNLEAAEAACSGPHDAIVAALVPFDQTCPNASEAYRDRQGMGTACVVRIAAAGSATG